MLKIYTVEKDICFKKVAVIKRDPSLCKNIKNEGWRKECEIIAKRDFSSCQKLETGNRLCQVVIALLEGNTSLCRKLETEAFSPIAI